MGVGVWCVINIVTDLYSTYPEAKRIMSSIQVLRDQKAALETDIARIMKAAEEKKKTLEDAIVRQRAQEIAQGKAEIQKIMQLYNLSANEVFGGAAPSGKKPAVGKSESYLSDIRKFYNGN
jgi:DNA-binding protein H-NS